MIGGKQLAILVTMLSLSNEYIIRYTAHTSMNGVEGNLAFASIYYFMHLKPEMFSNSLTKMTFLITIVFLGRSSSLLPWIPLAFLKIAEDTRYFIPIIVAGITVTLPAVAMSTGLDCFYYDTFTIPQINFVKINVI